MKQLDRVYEAYFGEMGEQFARKTRERIHWICSQVQGKNVLNIGCSQGITELILAREGKKVIGIDIEHDSISFAKEALEKESETVKKNVDYQVCSIFDFESDKRFETIILAEVLEHFTSSYALLEKVSSLIDQNGVIVITVPFGINDHIDHKKTYYLFNLIEEVTPLFQIIEMKFFGKWVGLVVKKNEMNSDGTKVNFNELGISLEREFYQIERQLIDGINRKNFEIKDLNNKLKKTSNIQIETVEEQKDLVTSFDKELMELRHKNSNLEQELSRLSRENNILQSNKLEMDQKYEKLKESYGELSIENNRLQKSELELNHKCEELKELNMQLSNEKNARQHIQKKIEGDLLESRKKVSELELILQEKNKDLIKRLENEEITLRDYKNEKIKHSHLKAKYDRLKADRAKINKKFKLLRNSKLGRITVKYWKMRKRISDNF